MASVRTTGAFVAAISMSMVLFSYFLCNYRSKRKSPFSLSKNKSLRNGLIHAVGNTPLIRINSLSEATGCEVSWRYALLLHIMIQVFHYSTSNMFSLDLWHCFICLWMEYMSRVCAFDQAMCFFLWIMVLIMGLWCISQLVNMYTRYMFVANYGHFLTQTIWYFSPR